MRTASATYFEDDSDVTVKIKNGIIHSPYTMTNNQGPPIRAAADDFQIDGLILLGGRFDPLYTSPLSASYIRNYQPIHSTGGITPSSNSNSSLLYVFEDFDPKGNDIDLKLWRAKKMKVLNSLPGTDLKIQGHQADNTNNRGLWEIAKEFKLSIEDASGTAIEGVRYFIRDYDNGDRNDFTAGTGDDTVFLADRTYTGLTNSSGETSTVEVLTGVVARNTGGAQGDPDAGLNRIDYRSKNDGNDDIFDIDVWSYNHFPATITTPLKGAGVKNIDWILLADDRITESDSTVVAAYTGIAINHTSDSEKVTISESHTLDEIFDYIKYNKTLEANIEKPTASTLAATPDGTALDFGDYDVEVTGADVELTAGTKYKSITTTGNVSTASDGTISVGYTDSAGSTVRVVSSVINTRIYCEIVTAGTINIADTGAGTEKYLLIPAGDTANITAKAEGYKYKKATIDPTTDTEILLSLESEGLVDSTISISDYTFEPDREFNFHDALSNAAGVVVQFGKRWVLDHADNTIYAFNLDGTRDSISDIGLADANTNAKDLTYTTDRLLVLDTSDLKFYAYDPSLGTHQSTDDFNLDDENTAPAACSNAAGKIMVADNTDGKSYAYQPSGTRVTTADYDFHSDNDDVVGMAFDPENSYHLVLDKTDLKFYAYETDGTRVTASEFDLDSANDDPESCTWDDGFVVVADEDGKKAYAYLDGARTINNNIFLRYDSTQSTLLFGVINIKNMQALSRRLFDYVMTTDMGLEFLHNFDNTITPLDGEPYEIRSDRIVINQTKLDFVLMSGVLLTEVGSFGFAVFESDRTTTYIPPTNSNGRVEIDTLATVLNVPISTIEEILENDTLIDGIGDVVVEKIDEDSTKLDEIIDDIEKVPIETLRQMRDRNILTEDRKTPLPEEDMTFTIFIDNYDWLKHFQDSEYARTRIQITDGTNTITSDHTGGHFGPVGSHQTVDIPAGTFPANTTSLTYKVFFDITNSLAQFIDPSSGHFDVKIGKARLTHDGVSYYIEPSQDSDDLTRLAFHSISGDGTTTYRSTSLNDGDGFEADTTFDLPNTDFFRFTPEVYSQVTDLVMARKILSNRKKVGSTTNKLTVYDDDGTTALYTFDLKDSSGSADSDDIYEADPE